MATNDDGAVAATAEPVSWNPALRPDSSDGQTMKDSGNLALDSGESSAQAPVQSVDSIPDPDPESFFDQLQENTHASDSPNNFEESPDQHATNTDKTEAVNGISTVAEVSPAHQEAQAIPEADVESHTEQNITESASGDYKLDSPLGLSRTATDPFEQEAIIGRTNSFPPVVEDSNVAVQNGHAAELEGNGDTAPQNSQGDDATSVTNGYMETSRDSYWGDSMNGNGDNSEEDSFNQLKTQTKPIYPPPEPESRFEEGIPLMNEVPETPVEPKEPVDPVEPVTQPESQIEKIFDGDEDEGDDFFSSVQKSFNAEAQQPHITRKSTSQVLDSLSFAQDSPISENPPNVLHPSDAEGAAEPTGAVKKMSSEEDLAARWQAELDDDDLLMDDEIPENTTASQAPVPETPSGPAEHDSIFGGQRSSIGSNPYVPHQPSSSELLQGLPVPGTQQGPGFGAPLYSPAQPQQKPASEKAESFVDKKDGYKSPYDLPADLTRPRKPVAAHKPIPPPGTVPPPATKMPPPPPRTNSFTGVPPPPAASSAPPAAPPTAPPAAPAVSAPKNFYEELPVTSRSRPASRGRYTPQPANTATTLTAPPPSTPGPYAGASSPAPQPAGDSYFQSQLQPPEPVGPYSNLSVPSAPSLPSSAARYSPKPPGLQPGTKPPASPRYSPAPPPQSPGTPARNRYASQTANTSSPATVLPFQPRTSSPLAYHEKNAYQLEVSQEPPASSAATLSPPRPLPPRQTLEQTPPTTAEQSAPVGVISGTPAADAAAEKSSMSPPTSQQMSPPRNPYAPPSYLNEFSKRAPSESAYAPRATVEKPQGPPPTGDAQFVPPRRSQTHSPGKQLSGPSLSMTPMEPFPRPASVHDPSSPTKTVSPYTASQTSTLGRGVTQQLEFIPPTDGQQFDPLERWRGAPIVNFGFGGAVVSCFPKHIPRYSAGSMAPMIKPSPGEVKIHQFNEFVLPADNIVQYPGPLKTKSKKKDVIAWLSSKIAAFENEGFSEAAQLHPEPHKRHEEKLLLWKIIKVLVEHDGVLEGTADVQKSLRNVISPGLQGSGSDQTYNGDVMAASMYQPAGASSQPDAVDPQTLEKLRNDLLSGDREKAVWGAVDGRLWGHAMLIASTLDKSIWKQVVQEFVRREVRNAGGNTESLAALYEIFAGNLEESIDELVPPSARAGLQMVSKLAGPEPTKNALDGLDRWRETLGLVLSNRSAEDHRALLALGRLLASYGRIEASHICYIFARASSPVPIFGGGDDPQACIVLLGTDHRQFPTTFMLDEDAILLTEVYEFATSVLAGSPTAVLPHFQALKLRHAISLADRGQKSEAQQYCDAIGGILKATTRPSPYYHQRLFSEVDELSTRLRQVSGSSDGGSSWISRPSMEKVSGSMWAKFNSFVAGDDSDAVSNASGKGDQDIGPFAKVTGTPTISRSPSVTDLYGSYPLTQTQSVPTSRYAPGSQYAPSSSPEQFRGRSSLDSQRSPSFGFQYAQRRGSQEPSTPSDYASGPFNMYGSPLASGYHSTPPQQSYVPLAPLEEDLSSQTQQQSTSMSPGQSSVSGRYNPGPATGPDSFGQPLYNPGSAEVQQQPENTGYEPPTSTSSYEPPSYQPDMPAESEDAEQSPVEEKPKKKSFMDDDDDDDLAARAAAIQKAEKERRDREADEAVRRAAEEDGKFTDSLHV